MNLNTFICFSMPLLVLTSSSTWISTNAFVILPSERTSMVSKHEGNIYPPSSHPLRESYQSQESDLKDKKKTSFEDKQEEQLQQSMHGHHLEMYDISKGSDHHLIDVDHNKLDDLGDKSVNVHELQLDAITVTFFSFAFFSIFLFILAFVDYSDMINLVARVQNSFNSPV